MLSKSKHFYFPSQLQARKLLNNYRQDYSHHINGANTLLHNAFCTVIEPLKANDSPVVDESPELPNWVKFPDKERVVNKKDDDDFVPPSLSYWIEQHKVIAQDVDMKSIVNDIIESDVDKISKILKNPFKSPDSVVKALDCCRGVYLPENLVDQILTRFSCEWLPAFGFFNWAELRNGFVHSPNLYNSMIDKLGKSKQFDVMWELLEKMKNLKGYVTLDTMTKVMRRLSKARKYEDAIEAFKKMEIYGVEKDVIAMNRLMDTFVKEGSIEHAEKVFIEYKQLITPTPQTYNVLVNGWCKIRKIDNAKRVVDEMKENGFQPDSITYTYFIEAYSREKDFRKVDSTLGEMEKNGLRPSVVTYTIIVNALAKAKETNKAMEIYEKMKENNCKLDSSFYNVFITALSRAGRLKDSGDVFNDMSKQGIEPDVLTYNTLILIASNDSQEEKALMLLIKMEENGCKPDFNTYTPLLKMCCRLRRMKVLSFLLSHMFRNDVSLGFGTYTLLVNGLCRNGRLDRACAFFEEMVGKGYVPMDCTYLNLVEGLEKKGMAKEKKEIEGLMVKAKEQGEGYSCKGFGKIVE